MFAEREYQAVLAHLEQDIDGFVGASFVEIETGRTLAAHSVRPEYPLPPLNAFGSELLNQQYRALESAGLTARLEEILVTTEDQFHLYRVVDRDVLLFVAADRAETSLALIKSVAHRRADAICALHASLDEDVA